MNPALGRVPVELQENFGIIDDRDCLLLSRSHWLDPGPRLSRRLMSTICLRQSHYRLTAVGAFVTRGPDVALALHADGRCNYCFFRVNWLTSI